MNRPRIVIVSVVALLGGVLSLSLLMSHHGFGAGGQLTEMLCGSGADSGCDAVAASPYASIGRFPLAAIGSYYYFLIVLLFGIAYFAEPDARQFFHALGFVLAAAGMLSDLALLGVQFVIIGRFCLVCLLTYLCTAILLALLWRPAPPKITAAWKALTSAKEGRMAVTALVQGALMLAVAVVTTNFALSNADIRNVQNRLTAQAVEEYERSPLVTLPMQGAPTLGDPGAPIKVVIFSDFLCPWCREAADFFKLRIVPWKDRVQVAFINYPLDQLCNTYESQSTHPGSCWAALGGLCSQEQSKFWEFHDRMFSNPPSNPTGQDIMRIAHEVGIDTTVLKSCMISVEMRKKVQSQIEEGHGVGVKATPRIFINGRLVPKLAALEGILQSEAARLGLRPLEGI